MLVLTTVFATWIAFGFSPTEGEKMRPSANPIVEGNNAFALDLYANLRQEEGNLFFSPYSVSSALAMTFAGARRITEVQMAHVLHFPIDQRLMHPVFADAQAQINEIQKDKNIELHTANALWIQKGLELLKTYLDLIDKYYGAGLNYVDYKKSPEAAREKINKWVEDKTKNKIKDLLQPGTVDNLTRLVLTNAIYFRGDWLKPFEEECTEEDSFRLSQDESIKVPMMHQMDRFGFTENDLLKILAMPYKGEDLAMIVLLPNKIDGLAELETALNKGDLNKWLSQVHSDRVNVVFPKFKMTKEFELSTALSAMGMPDAFDPEIADFSGMDKLKQLYISKVVHKAFVDVNERGTEAAAATGVVMELTSAMPQEPPKEFRADHPFIFLIRHKPTASILFMGRVVNPNE